CRTFEDLIFHLKLADLPTQFGELLLLRRRRPGRIGDSSELACVIQLRRHESEIRSSRASWAIGLSPARARSTGRCRDSRGVGAGKARHPSLRYLPTSPWVSEKSGEAQTVPATDEGHLQAVERAGQWP